MSNPRMTPRERGLLKGAMRRVFARSDLRRSVLEKAYWPEYNDPSRPRVKTWVKCSECERAEAKSYVVVDHKTPVIPLDKSFEQMTLDEVVDRMWCEPSNLQAICESCHLRKTQQETIIRKKHKQEKKKNGQSSKGLKRPNSSGSKRPSNRRVSKGRRRKTTKSHRRAFRQSR